MSRQTLLVHSEDRPKLSADKSNHAGISEAEWENLAHFDIKIFPLNDRASSAQASPG
jgi:hypothetical protein